MDTLNSIKLDLGIAVLAALASAALLAMVSLDPRLELALILVVSVSGAGWVVLRTRRVVRRVRREVADGEQPPRPSPARS